MTDDPTPAPAPDVPVHCAHAAIVDIADLRPNPRNPNRHGDEQVALLAKNIRALGWRHPVIVSKRSGLVVAGHARIEAARLLNVATVPVDYQEFGSDDEETAYLIADNRIAELAERDNAAIKDLIEELDRGQKTDAGQLIADLTGYCEAERERLANQTYQGEPTDPEAATREKAEEEAAREQRLEDNPKLREWIEKRKRNQERGKDASEVNFWLCLVFQSHDQKHEFLAKYPGLAEETVYGMYCDGEKFAARVGQPVTPNEQKLIQVTLDKTLTGMVNA